MSSASPQHNGLQLQQQPSTRKTIRAKSIQTTKWGTACSQCASAKAKCSRQSNSQQSKCERCERLLKQCTNQVHRPRKAREAKPRSLNEARDYGSEEPGEALTPSSGYSPSPSADQRGTSSTCSSPRGGNSMSGRPSPQERRSIARSSSNYSNSSPENPREAGMPYATSHPRSQSRNPSYTGAVESDEELLAVFRNELMPQYPFVLIPSNMSADELNAWRPFLMSTIRMAASFKNAESMRGQMFQIMSYLADHMLLRAEHSIDLLMGVIVVLGWYHYHSMTHTQLNNLLCLAESLMSGLGINQPLFTQSREAITKTNEEKRLLLGLWYLRSVASGHFHMLQPIPFTATMSEYLEGLERDSEERSDDFLVYLVKIQHLSERIVETTTASIGSKAQEATVTKLQNTLRRSAGTLPHQLKSNAIIAVHLNTAFLRGHELATNMGPHSSPTVMKTWFESWLSSIPASSYHILPTSAIFQLSYAVGVLARSTKTTSGMTDFGFDFDSPRHAAALQLTGFELVEYLSTIGQKFLSSTGFLIPASHWDTNTLWDFSSPMIPQTLLPPRSDHSAGSSPGAFSCDGSSDFPDHHHHLLNRPIARSSAGGYTYDFDFDYPRKSKPAAAAPPPPIMALGIPTTVGGFPIPPALITPGPMSQGDGGGGGSQWTPTAATGGWDLATTPTWPGAAGAATGSSQGLCDVDPRLWFETSRDKRAQIAGQMGWEEMGFEDMLGYQ